MTDKDKMPFYLIYKKRYKDYWDNRVDKMPHILKLSKDFKNLFFKLVCYKPKHRPDSVKNIFDEPWLIDVKDFKEEDYIEYENMMKNLEKEINKDNETFDNIPKKEDNNNIKANNTGKKAAKDDDEEILFNVDLKPSYLDISGMNAMNYIKIKGELEPAKFMNSFSNQLIKEFDCKIEPIYKKLKFKAIFPNIIKEEIENQEEVEDKEKDKEEDDEEKENIENSELKDCEIRIELFESINGGYEIHFNKGKGYFTDYYTYFLDIKQKIKEILY